MSSKGHKWSEEAKKKRSEKAKKYYREHPEALKKHVEKMREVNNRLEKREAASKKMKEYRKEHPMPSVKGLKWSWSEEARKKNRAKQKEVMNRSEVKKIMREAQKKYWLEHPEGWSEERKKKQSEAIKKSWENPEIRKKRHDGMVESWGRPETRERKSECMRKIHNRIGAKEKISERAKRYWAGLSYEKRLCVNLPGRMAVKFISEGESTLCGIVCQHYPTAKGSQWIAGYQADIVIPELKINIEYDGIYWHQNPKKDRARDEVLQKLGWAILRVREKEPFDINVLHELVKSRSEHGENPQLQRIGND